MIEQSVLENRIRVVTKHLEGVRSISLGFLMASGPMDEPEAHSGVAHLTEHLIFGGTRTRDDAAIARMMDTTGGQVGGFTSRDYTCFTTTVLDDYRTYLIDLMGDILIDSQFTESSVHQEKDIIIREISTQLDQPDICAHERMKSHIWRGHPLGRAIGGTISSVAQLQRQDVVDFFSQNYQPRRLIIAAAGNLNHQDVVTNISDSFWNMRDDRKSDTSPPPPTFNGGISVECKGVTHVYFSIAIKAAPYTSSDRYIIHLLTTILGGGLSSRLFRKLRQETGMVYEISSEYQAYKHDGVIVIEGSTTPELLHSVLSRILLELHGIALGMLPIDAEELWIAKMQLKGRHLISQENSHTCMSSLATQTFYFGKYIESEEICSKIEEVDIDKINFISKKILQEGVNNPAISIVGPQCDPVCNTHSLENILKEFSQLNH
jgi:predicted Zn-dependent peptidase